MPTCKFFLVNFRYFRKYGIGAVTMTEGLGGGFNNDNCNGIEDTFKDN